MEVEKEVVLKKLSQLVSEEYGKYYKTNLDFAAACDVDEKTIRRILLGKQNMSLGIFLKICEAIKIHPSDVFKKMEL